MIMIDERMLSVPHAAGEEWFLVCRQMQDVLAELLPSPTDSFSSPDHLQRPRYRNERRGTSKVCPWSRGRMGCDWTLHQFSAFPYYI